MIWLGTKHGYLSDWFTQRWVQCSARKATLADNPWLSGPIAPTSGIGAAFFEEWARSCGLKCEGVSPDVGIIQDFSQLRGKFFDPTEVHHSVASFYEKTAGYELDSWAEWRGFFRPFGWLLAVLFSRRLQQLNVPLSGLDTSRGMTNEVLRFRDSSDELAQTAWLRKLRSSGNVLYAGFYSICRLPNHPDPCIKVVFPLPNGNAIVIMKTESRADRSFVITSSGVQFGDPGFYFTVTAGPGIVWARYVRSMRESIHVYPGENDTVRADHALRLWGLSFLNLHYRMRKISPGI